MKTRFLTFLMLFFIGSAFAQGAFPHPDFYFPEPVQSDDGMNGTCVALIYLNSVQVEEEATLEIAFFDEDGNCRQRDFIHHWVAPNGDDYGYQFQSVMYGNSGQTLTFKFYNHTLRKSSDELGYVCITSFTYVPNIEFGILTAPENVYFVTPATCTFTNVDGNNWSTAANWEPRIPASCDDAVIDGACLVDEGCTPSYATLTIKDGAQFYDLNEGIHTPTVEKEITGYNSTKDNYYLISSPIGNPFNFASTQMLSGEYDLYFFQIDGIDENEERKEWQNYKLYESLEILENFNAPYGGYLYANHANTTLQFTGQIDNSEKVYTLKTPVTDYCEGERFAGFNLIGNTLACNAVVTGNNKVLGYYMINEENNRSNVVAVTNPIAAPCTALFVSISKPSSLAPAKITFTPTLENANVRKSNSNINIEINNAAGNLIDRAYVEFGEKEGLKKFNLNEDVSQIYFRQGGQNFAIVRTTDATQLPLFFETREYGQYTINVKLENLTCEYLHLIDNLTGMDVDLLATPSYTFQANSSDYAARFKIVFEGTGVEENTANESFAIVEGNRVIIPAIEHESTLEVIDMTGRTVSSQKVNGSFDQTLNVKAGLYILNLNGMTQKIVVE